MLLQEDETAGRVVFKLGFKLTFHRKFYYQKG